MGWTFLGFEAAGSIAEEVHEPAKNVPRAIVGVCVGIGVITLFVTVAFILAIPDIERGHDRQHRRPGDADDHRTISAAASRSRCSS